MGVDTLGYPVLKMTSLDLAELFNKYGSDKDRNGYTAVYSTLFDRRRDEAVELLEIGIGTLIPDVPSSMQGYSLPGYAPGGSLRAWRDYFPNGHITGMDIQPDTQFEEDRIRTYLCDSTKSREARELMKTLGKKFDIIIDDGCHTARSQLATLRNFYPHLKDGGIYIIEDIPPGSEVSTRPEYVRMLVNNDPHFFVGLNNNQCIIFKKHLNTPY